MYFSWLTWERKNLLLSTKMSLTISTETKINMQHILYYESYITFHTKTKFKCLKSLSYGMLNVYK